eukprot:15367013-Ditylum_brightwellii.AAC.1
MPKATQQSAPSQRIWPLHPLLLASIIPVIPTSLYVNRGRNIPSLESALPQWWLASKYNNLASAHFDIPYVKERQRNLKKHTSVIRIVTAESVTQWTPAQECCGGEDDVDVYFFLALRTWG